MKKVVILVVGSLMVMSCGEKEETPYVKSVDEMMVEYNTKKLDSCLTYFQENKDVMTLEQQNRNHSYIQFYHQKLNNK